MKEIFSPILLPYYKKSLLFRKLSKGRYDEIIDSINRDIRNAEAHLNLKYIPSEGVFTLICYRKEKKIDQIT
ncbi:hypothetical protein [Clostridium botulinum]|uniref:hypothetical protein n=1 Tax=Clostridium botulinum TaxID=1491 RepID=UPI0004D9535E|nr:hypothetical protein [Clostridium botulinum]KEI00113.1 hypothetical protein Z952_14105 [Clostridium botulinum C/D str. BKT75002]KEI06013.1 hypothetical protein Z954_14325 [Clostridium botulinum C/D str. BKT2873]MCD3352006.1 hypothetical protein [Clostridium botulinum D/C]MCD3360954.1 hypothetical protein [Clostridium botulinum D/C]MCD3363909.1 hypothetical protein [Clostridium botulinum D/C]